MYGSPSLKPACDTKISNENIFVIEGFQWFESKSMHTLLLDKKFRDLISIFIRSYDVSSQNIFNS